jgi:hypothetical protein
MRIQHVPLVFYVLCSVEDPDPDRRIRTSDPTPDLTSFFSDFTDAKKNFFFIFFLLTYLQT